MFGQPIVKGKPVRQTTCSSSLKKPSSSLRAPAFLSSSPSTGSNISGNDQRRRSSSQLTSSNTTTAANSRQASQSSLLAASAGGKSTSRTSVMSDITTISFCSSLPAGDSNGPVNGSSRKSLNLSSSASSQLTSRRPTTTKTISSPGTGATSSSSSSSSSSSAAAARTSSSTRSTSLSSSLSAASTARRVPTLAMSLRDKDQQIKLLIKERDEQKFQAEMMARKAEDWEEKFVQSELEKSHVTSEADDEVVELRRLTQELEDENKRLAEKLGEKELQISDTQFKLDELECERSQLKKELEDKEDQLEAMEKENEELANGKPIVQVTTERAISKQKYEREIEELKEKILGRDEQMIQLRSSLEMKKNEVNNLQAHAGDLERKLKIESERSERHMKRIDEINLELKAAEAKLNTKTEENDMYERQVKTLRQELRSAEEKLEQISLARKKDVEILHSKLSAARRGSTTPTSPQPFKTPTPQDELVRLQMEIRDLKDQLIDREAELDCNRRDIEVMRRKMETRTLEVDCNNQELARRCQDLLEQNRQSEDTVKQLLKSSGEHSTQLMRATEDLKEANSKCIKLREEINELESNIEELVKKNHCLLVENTNLRDENNDYKEQIETLRQQVDSLNEQLSDLCEQLDSQTNTLHKDREALAKQLSQNDIDIAQMRHDLASAKQDLRTSKLQTQEVASERDRIKTDLDMKEKYISSRNDIIETLRHELEDGKKSIADYKQKIEALRQSSSQIETAEQASNKELKFKLDNLKRDYQIKNEELIRLEMKCEKLQKELDETKSSNEEEELNKFDEMRQKHSEEIDQLKVKLKDLEEQLEEAKSMTLKQRDSESKATTTTNTTGDDGESQDSIRGSSSDLKDGSCDESQKTREKRVAFDIDSNRQERKEEYESQIEFLNSVVVDMQRKCDDYKNRLAQIETMNIMKEFDNLIVFNQPLSNSSHNASTTRRPLSNGLQQTVAINQIQKRDPPKSMNTATLNRPSNIINSNRFNGFSAPDRPVRISGRPYCDICSVYDLHHTIYCPKVTEKLASRQVDTIGGSQSSNSSIINNNNNNNYSHDNNNSINNNNNNNIDHGLNNNVDDLFREYEQSIDVATVEQYTSLRRPRILEKPPRAYCDHCDLFGHTTRSCNPLKSLEQSNKNQTQPQQHQYVQ